MSSHSAIRTPAVFHGTIEMHIGVQSGFRCLKLKWGFQRVLTERNGFIYSVHLRQMACPLGPHCVTPTPTKHQCASVLDTVPRCLPSYRLQIG
jgi:hypothetical protein